MIQAQQSMVAELTKSNKEFRKENHEHILSGLNKDQLYHDRYEDELFPESFDADKVYE